MLTHSRALKEIFIFGYNFKGKLNFPQKKNFKGKFARIYSFSKIKKIWYFLIKNFHNENKSGLLIFL